MALRFDDSLETVLAGDVESPSGAPSAWRQIVDLIGRGRAAPDPRAFRLLETIRGRVPLAAREASVRALEFARPPASLVRLLAVDVLPVARPVLRTAQIDDAEWIALLPQLSAEGRHVLRHRRDLSPAVVGALAAFGADFTLADQRTAPEVAPVAPPPGLFAVADIVARIDAHRRERADRSIPAAPPVPQASDFRFETDVAGVIRWVEGVDRAPVIGLSFDLQGVHRGSRLDGVAAGAFRRRAAFTNARMTIAGDSSAAGDWLISAIPTFDPLGGRFCGYRGTARRPRVDERAEPLRQSPVEADLLRQLVHELRTPTNAIAGFAEMIEAQMLGPVPAAYRERAAFIRGQVRELLGAIDDLDLAARIESAALALAPGTVALRSLLSGIAADLAELLALRGSALILPEDDALISGDARAVERLLARLLATLVSASARGERLALRLEREKSGFATIRIDRPAALGDYPGDAMLAIDDEGTEDLTLLGAGFALRLARNLARELGGSLSIASDSLSLQLPLAEAAAGGHVQRS
ncbi:histidine kinase dimerization/phospho-acceptor domain-containing protein [Sphingomonas sp. HT-1]|uniref:histidine kinase dimerization/phospho-acceptor domain-containing protein n=1 Tax=unclassified Sphingomonas TaxID=196159 RepID=UPI000310790C|nr:MULTISPECIES: histidine kinase dimerization/phospho-acceptor domain-containing protein [unclassified Sphingomonas]